MVLHIGHELAFCGVHRLVHCETIKGIDCTLLMFLNESKAT